MKTKQRNLFVALILSVAIIFGTFGALSLTNVNKASALSSVTADATLTDFEAVNSKAKIIENEGAASTTKDACPVYFTPKVIGHSITDKVEFSIDVYKFSKLTFYFRTDSHWRPTNTGLHLFSYNNGNLCFTRSASGWVFYEDKVSLNGTVFNFPAADGSGASVTGDGNTVKGNAGYNVENGFNIKATIYSSLYTANITAAKNIVKFVITPYDENGNAIESRQLTYYSWGTSGIDISTTYRLGACFLGDNGITIVDNFKVTNYTDAGEVVLVNNEFNTFVGTTAIPTTDVPFIGVKDQAGTREIVGDIFNNADGIVSKTAINDKQYIIDGEMSLTQLDNGKKMGLLLGMANKTDNVGVDGTSYAYFTNEDGITYFGVDENKVSLGSNLVGGKVNYKLQVNNDGSVIADVNGSKLFFAIPKENVNGYIAYKSSGAGTVNASVDATTINTYNVVGEMSEGASIRLGTLINSGMRFETTFTKETVDAFANAGYKSIEYGTLITRADLLNGSSVTIEELDAKSIWYKTIVSTISDPDAEDKVYCGSLISINAQNFGKEFIGRGYVKVVDANDNEIYFYADFFGGDVANNTRSVKWIAERYKASDEYSDYELSLNGAENVVDAYINGVSNVG